MSKYTILYHCIIKYINKPQVHIQLHSRMDMLRVAVRGLTPCCTMKTILNFIELYLDDVPEEEMGGHGLY